MIMSDLATALCDVSRIKTWLKARHSTQTPITAVRTKYEAELEPEEVGQFKAELMKPGTNCILCDSHNEMKPGTMGDQSWLQANCQTNNAIRMFFFLC